jgi:hypothetical protein
MKMRICKCCERRILDGSPGNVCGKCRARKTEVHELYLICQLIRKKAGMSYDPILDKELTKKK